MVFFIIIYAVYPAASASAINHQGQCSVIIALGLLGVALLVLRESTPGKKGSSKLMCRFPSNTVVLATNDIFACGYLSVLFSSIVSYREI